MTAHTIPALRIDQSSEGGRAFFQQRFGQYLYAYGLLGLFFLVVRVLGQAFAPSTVGRWDELTRPDFWAHAAATALSLGGWLYARGSPRALTTLERAEMVFIYAVMFSYVLMGYLMPPGQSGMLTVYLATTMGLFARAIYVPSTPRRSMSLALSIAVPSIVLAYMAWSKTSPEFAELMAKVYNSPDLETHRTVNTVFFIAWWTGTVAMTTAASRVIYGLRREVQDAQRLGQYQLEEKLGEGGMGIVYRASHALLQRPTAVKLLPEDKVGEKSVARFEREVRLTARLTHPNTITIFDYGRTPDGVFYYAMELLDGATLATVVETTGPLPPARVAHILGQAAAALAEAHGIGLIHRDIKPANIMLCEQGGVPDTVKVLDFGLVKEVDQVDDVGLTQGNVVTGTPQYMPPEALTHPDSVDGRSDIYCLGAVAFYLLTGEHVFTGNTVVEICGHHLHTPPRRSSELAEVPTALDDLVDACLAKEPDERPQRADDIVEQLERMQLAGWTRRDARAWWSEHADAVGVREMGLADRSAK